MKTATIVSLAVVAFAGWTLETKLNSHAHDRNGTTSIADSNPALSQV